MARLTAHGVPMSPRMERLYNYFDAKGVALTSWSTDQCVARELPKLQRLLEELPKDPTLASLTDLEFNALEADIMAIMRRTPAARVA